MHDISENAFKRSLSLNDFQLGLWSSMASPAAAEILAFADADWILLDCEHSPNDLKDVVHLLRAVTGGRASPVVRPPWNDAIWIKRLLDVGVQSFLVPFVETAEECEAVVKAVRYPPHGVRGVSVAHRANRYGRIKNYLASAQDEICVVVQIESQKSIDNLDNILGVEGLDGVFVGPSDLAANLGHLGNPQHPDVQRAIADICSRARHKGIPAGILAGNADSTVSYREMGFTFIAAGADIGLLRQGVDALCDTVRSGVRS
ncbi:HpcH/HpaI aldolase family protein [Halomonas sp. BC04]|uniref:HpcH/HpaI aldolase family protein n=1 Tax=Halomonas sp. BC04 TaxID=1403540 RepID=UPI0003ED8831|nr:aldolase/citrate lyase family protein [Halomonas sp. BC04]EWG98375.1 alpha-dehydro-beta-deoxy-D-glucarate aldolase [Halomonas sp. BC04]